MENLSWILWAGLKYHKSPYKKKARESKLGAGDRAMEARV